ncbi:MAG: ferritin-like domain-containing protein [Chitinophagaceae bacterium]|nr:MAG: ferritin-like domain-containing protein [Chitinophagaceae bacterium]
MEKLNDLRDLLKHELQDLYSVEEQIIAALPKMIAKAGNQELKASLEEHLRVTEQQKARLETLQQQMDGGAQQESGGLLGRLFKSRMVCEGMQGIIKESNKLLSEDMNPDVVDAVIIACAQKVEHYEICGYGTARAYAEELGLTDIAAALKQTLDEEYAADDRLTALAEGRLNRQAEEAGNKEKAPAKSRGAGKSSPGSGSEARAQQPQPELELASAGRSGKNAANGKSAAGTEGRSTSRAGKASTPSSTPVSKGASAGAARSAASSGGAGRSATSTGRSISGSARINTGGTAGKPAASAKSTVRNPASSSGAGSKQAAVANKGTRGTGKSGGSSGSARTR